MMRRIEELETLLKDRVAGKNARISDLNKELVDSSAEIESLRTENREYVYVCMCVCMYVRGDRELEY